MSEFLLQNAQRMHKAGNFAEAARLYGEVLRLNPRQFQALYALGFLRYQAAQFGEAERLMSEALELPMDVTLQQLLEAVETGSVDLISTDIFDTLVWRITPEPPPGR